MLAFLHCRFQVNACLLVCLDELGKSINFKIIFETYQPIHFISVITNMDLVGINKLNHAITIRVNLNSRITGSFTFQTCSYNRIIRADQWYSLALHVRSHQCTVGIIMLKEWDQRSAQSNNLVWRNVHIFYIILIKDREVTRLTAY